MYQLKWEKTFNLWVEDSRNQNEPCGHTIDNHPRFDLEPSDSMEKSAMRRVNAPVEVSDTLYEAMASSNMTDRVWALLRPNIKFDHSRINSNKPGGGAAVK